MDDETQHPVAEPAPQPERQKIFKLVPKAQQPPPPGQPAPKSDLIDQLLGLLKMANEGALTSFAWVGTKRDDDSGEDDEFGWGWSNTSELPRMRGYLRYLDDALGEATYATGGKRL